MVGTNVFIGHGSSKLWRKLKDFIEHRLGLPVDEFNSVPVAGISTTARLSELLGAAAFAFLIMTAEDEQADGKIRARENVVHEVGLFQGRLGFTRAIVLLEEGWRSSQTFMDWAKSVFQKEMYQPSSKKFEQYWSAKT